MSQDEFYIYKINFSFFIDFSMIDKDQKFASNSVHLKNVCGVNIKWNTFEKSQKFFALSKDCSAFLLRRSIFLFIS